MSKPRLDFMGNIDKLKIFQDEGEYFIYNSNPPRKEMVWYIDITPMIKYIFGKGIVKKAVLRLDSNLSKEEAKIIADKIVDVYNQTKRFDFDDFDLIMTLSNNVKIKISSSEWGTISQVKGVE